MSEVWDSFRECGAPAYLVTLLAALGVVATLTATILAVAQKSRGLSIAAAVLTVIVGAGAITVGILGQLTGRARTDEALYDMSASSAIDAAAREEIRKEGYRESAQCIPIGVGGGALPLTAGIVLLVVSALAKRPRPVASE